MHNSRNKNRTTIFTIDIKVSGESMSIPVYEGENYEELIKRFCQQHVFKAHYQEAIKDKIIQSLVETVKKAGISAALKNKVNTFLGAKQQQSQSHSRKKSQKQLKFVSNQSTPFKAIDHQSNPSHSHRKSVTNRHIGAHAETEQDKSLKSIHVKREAKPAVIRKNKVESSKIFNPNTSKNKASAVKPQDPDLISAYEVIYKKAKQPQMKSMAKKFLQDCGHIRPNTHDHKKAFDPSAQFKKLSKNEPGSNQISPKPPQSAQPNNSDIHSLTQFQVIQPKISKSPDRHIANPTKQSPKKHRIRYDLGQDVVIQKHDTEDLNYSRYQLGRSSRRERASVSYNRLPAYVPHEAQQRSSFRNSRLVSNFNYDYNNYNDPERAISLRRTRKYKYL